MFDREEKPKKRKLKKKCIHIRQRKVVGRDGEILWYECTDCPFDFPLIK